MKNLTEKTLKRPVTAFMVFTCFVLIGIIASGLLPLEYMPDMNFPFIFINIPYPGSTPEEIERQITRPVEEALATISNVNRMISNSSDDSCGIFIIFDWGANTEIKAVEIKEKIDNIRHLLPNDVERIILNKENPSDQAVLTMRLSSDKDLSQYFNMLNRVLKRPLERIDGVSRIDMYGAEKKQIRIQLIADRVTAHKVDLGRLSEILQRSNFMISGGRITDAGRRFRVRPIGEFTSIKDIENLIVGDNNLRLSDIAEVGLLLPERNYGRHLNRKYAVGLDVFKEAGANTVETIDNLKKELERIKKDPRMEGITIFFMDDKSEGIVSSLMELLKSGMVGASLAILLLLFFLRRWSTTFIVALAVPFSIMVTLAFMYFLGLSLNILSMMGLMLAVGMLVDNAVVVTESIHRHQIKGKNIKDASITGVKEVALAITAGTLTTVVVFLPAVVNQKDFMSMYMKHVSMAFIIALVGSLVLAQTIVPLLTSRVKLPKKEIKNKSLDRLMSVYGRILDWTLRKRKLSILLVLLLLISIAVPISFVKTDMFPEHRDRRLFLRYNINGAYTLERVEELVYKVEEYLYQHQEAFEIESVYSYFQGNRAESTINLLKGSRADKSQDEIRKAIEEGLPKVAIGQLTFERRRNMGTEDKLRIFLNGKSSSLLADLSKDVVRTLSRVEGLKDVRSEAEAGEQEVRVVVDREKAVKYGFSTQAIANMVSVAMRGVNLRRFRDEYGEVDVRVEYQRGDKQTLDQLKNLVLYDAQQRPVKLSTLASFVVRRGPRVIHRENRMTALGVVINMDNLTAGEAKKKISNVLDRYNFPPGYYWSYGTGFNFGEEAAMNMVINILLAMVLIYIIMAALFESLVFPAAIVSSILFAIIGVYWFFMFTGTTFTMMAMIGILILIGVVVNNGIVLIDHINRFRDRGLNRHDAIVEAGRERIRPILMTAGTTVLSLIPLCIVSTQIGGDGPPYFPMARAIVGGLTFSTIVTLLVLPRIYVLLDDLRNWASNVVSSAAARAGYKTAKERIGDS